MSAFSVSRLSLTRIRYSPELVKRRAITGSSVQLVPVAVAVFSSSSGAVENVEAVRKGLG